MDGRITVGGLSAEPGEKVMGEVSLAEGRFRIPGAILRGREPGRTVLITGGIHGGEYVGIETAIELAERLETERVCGIILILKAVSRTAFEGRKGSMGPSDGKNLNRVFPGDPDGTETEALAWALNQEIFPLADYYIDLHSGDDYEQLTPYVYYAGKASREVADCSRQMAQQVDVPYMVRSEVALGGAYNYAASRGIPSILLERGGMGAWNMEEVHSARRDVYNILCHLGIYRGQKDYRKHYPLEVEDVCYQAAAAGGMWYPAKKPGDMIRRGESLGEIRDYEGSVLERIRAELDGVLLYQTGSLQVLKEGPLIAYGRIAADYDDRKERIARYWGKRSDSFMDQRRAELKSPLASRWMEEILPRLPEGKELKILDVGCGSGFFSILLAREGHEVTGVDLTPEMVERSILLAREEKVRCRFQIMDGENLKFEDETFDAVISRNLTWTLPDAARAYREWMRVLKPGGVLLNFDANYGASDCTDKKDLPENHAHHTLGDEMLLECEEIKRQLPISTYARPAWDLETLGRIGAKDFQIDLGISGRIYREKDEFYNPTPLFLLRVCKEKEES